MTGREFPNCRGPEDVPPWVALWTIRHSFVRVSDTGRGRSSHVRDGLELWSSSLAFDTDRLAGEATL
jgi:hypothetical protein